MPYSLSKKVQVTLKNISYLFFLFNFIYLSNSSFAVELKKYPPTCIEYLDRPYIPGQPQTPEDLQDLKVGAYNTYNFFDVVKQWINPLTEQMVTARPKPDWEKESEAQLILDEKPHVLTVEEMESLPVLSRFNHQKLNDQFRPMLIEGNDARGIDVGQLIHTSLPLAIEQHSHKGEMWVDSVDGKTKHIFSRDLPIWLYKRTKESPPLFIVVGTHYKSKLDRAGDPEATILRSAQIVRTVEILKEYREVYGANLPIIINGDFNTNVETINELKPLFDDLKMLDVFNLVQPKMQHEDRITHTWHPKGAETVQQQIDAILISQSLVSCLKKAYVYRYKDQFGRPKPIPNKYPERQKNPSDHFPIFAVFDMKCILSITESP